MIFLFLSVPLLRDVFLFYGGEKAAQQPDAHDKSAHATDKSVTFSPVTLMIVS